MDTPAHLFNRRLGEYLRTLRTNQGAQQEQIAAAARALGLKWDRSTVNAIERGVRQLLVYELIVLPGILMKVGITTLNGMEIPYDAILTVVQHELRRSLKAQPASTGREAALQAIIEEEVVQRTAPRYKVPPELLARASLKLWGHGLTAERELRFKRLHGDVVPTRALRGHVTRQCMAEIEQVIDRMKRSRKGR
jgi:transcriptional regulator with XRE-family HTH domain